MSKQHFDMVQGTVVTAADLISTKAICDGTTECKLPDEWDGVPQRKKKGIFKTVFHLRIKSEMSSFTW